MAEPRYLFCAECHLKLATHRVTRSDDKAAGSYGVCSECLEELRKNPSFGKMLRLYDLPPGPPFADERWNKAPASIIVSRPVTAGKLATLLGVKPFHIIAILIPMKCFVTADKPLPPEAVQMLAKHYDTEILVTNDEGQNDV